MRDWQRQSHVRWYGKSHMVFVPKDSRRVIDGQRRRRLGRIIRDLCQQPGVALGEGHAMPAHVPLGLSSPPQVSVANTGGWLTGKSAIRMHRACLGRERHWSGWHCWARGSCVSPVGLDEQVIRESIRNQEQEEKRQEALQWKGLEPLSEEARGP